MAEFVKSSPMTKRQRKRFDRRGRNALRYDRLDRPEEMNDNMGSRRYQGSYKDIERPGKTVRLYEYGEKMQINRPVKGKAPVKRLRKRIEKGGGYGYGRLEATLSRTASGSGNKGTDAERRRELRKYRRWMRRVGGGRLPHQRSRLY